MALQASSVVRTSQETRPEQRPASPQPTVADLSAATRRELRPLEVAECAMCGIALPLALLVPDGGRACADIRWYCKDAKSCTERWTASLPRHPHIAPTPLSLAPPSAPMTAPMPVPMSAGGPVPDPVPMDLLGAPEEAWSIDPS